jgi:DNA polymerase-3 subunit alpha
MRYVHQRYGQERVAQIITFGTLGVRAAIRDAGRALDMPLSEVDRIARLVPAVPGMPITLGEVLEGPRAVKEVRELYDTQDYVRRLLDTARSLEGVARHASTHAAGVVVADRPLTHYVPLHRPTRGSSDGLPVTQYPMQAVERLGLLKIDVLGLKTLSVLRRAAELIREHHAVSFNFDNIPLDDPKVYELLSSGEVTGLFQVEGAGMRRLLREMQPSRFEHIMAAISLHRPGPMEYIPDYLARMHGKQPVTYRHPALEPILAETYGIIVYQEQIIRLAQELAGYEPGDADLIRKAVGKKQRDELLEHRNRFIEGALANRVPSDVAAKIFDDIEFFARYGFNKAHAADYALIVCRTAYLKAHYPVEYMTALLNVERGDTERVALIAADCLAMGIAVLPPDINRSQADFSIERLEDGLPAAADGPAGGRAWHQRAIRFGLAAVKNVGQGPVEAILEGRSAAGGGPFSSLEDLGRRVDLRAVQRRALECLTKVGALDSLGARPELLAMLDRMLSYSQAHLEAREAGQMSLFEAGPGGQQESLLGAPGHVEPVSQRQQLAWEKELLGVYLSGHPLRRLGGGLAGDVTAYCGQIDSSLAGQVVTVAGMLTAVRRITTRKGDAMLFASLEDLHGSIELTVFPRVYEATADLWQPDNLLLVRGRVEQRDERVQLVCESAQLYAAGGGQPAGQGNGPAEAPDNGPAAGTPNGALSAYHVFVTVHRSPDEQADVELLRSVYSLLEGYDGRDRFSLVVNKGPGRQVQLDFPNSTTRYCMALVSQLEQLVGEGGVRAQPLS